MSADPQMDALQQALTNAINMLANLTLYPKPSYSIDGQSVSWESYYAMLLRAIPMLREQIQVQGGPFEIPTQAMPGSGGLIANP